MIPIGSYHQRTAMKKYLKSGKALLRVVGSTTEGFRLAGERHGKVIAVGQTFKKQSIALEVGYTKYNQKAVKYTAPKEKAA